MSDSAPTRRCLITGATSGLGRAMAVQLARRGDRVAITGRRETLLLELEAELCKFGVHAPSPGSACHEPSRMAGEGRGGGESKIIALHGGVDDPQCVAAHYAQIKEQWGGLDLAILNAGVGGGNDAKTFAARPYLDTFATNVHGVCNWLEQIIPDMIAQRSGVIAGISSPGGWRGFPGVGPYCASKAALSTLLESTRIELRGTGVHVVDVCPGYVKSEMTANNDPKKMPFLLETEDGAARILRGIDARKRIVHFPWQLTWPLRHIIARLPGWLFDQLAALYGKP